MADNLEKYFKKHLSDETASEDMWNVPSDDVWEKALPLIRKKKGLYIPLRNIYIISAFILLGLMITLGILFFPGLSDRADHVAGSRITAEDESIESNEVAPGPGTHEIVNPPGTETNTEVLVDAKGADTDSDQYINNVTEINKVRSSGQTEADKPDVKKHTAIVETLAASAATPESGTGTRSLLRKSDPLISAHVMPRTRGTPPMLYQKESLSPEYSVNVKRSFISRKNKFGIGLYYAPTYNNTVVSGELSAGKLETGNHYLYSGNYGLTLKYYLSDRLSVVSGFGSLKVKSWSEATTAFEYDGSNEHIMPGGDKENMSGIPMATPFGEIGTEITYRFPENESIPDGEPMEAILETHQDISYFSIPLGVEFDLLPVSKHMQWYAEGGVRFNWASGDATEFNSRILHYGSNMNVVNEIMMNHPDYTDYFLDFYIGSGLSYSFTKYFMLQGSLRYSRNMTKVNVQDDLYTRVQAAGLKISLIYFF